MLLRWASLHSHHFSFFLLRLSLSPTSLLQQKFSVSLWNLFKISPSSTRLVIIASQTHCSSSSMVSCRKWNVSSSTSSSPRHGWSCCRANDMDGRYGELENSIIQLRSTSFSTSHKTSLVGCFCCCFFFFVDYSLRFNLHLLHFLTTQRLWWMIDKSSSSESTLAGDQRVQPRVRKVCQ